MTTVLATTVQPGLAMAMSLGKLAVDARDERPDPDAIGKTLMLAAEGIGIVGCAKLAGVVTLRGTRYPDTEHPQSERIIASIEGRPVDRACLWVFEDGVLFGEIVNVRVENRSMWTVPTKHHETLRAAYRAAKERRKA